MREHPCEKQQTPSYGPCSSMYSSSHKWAARTAFTMSCEANHHAYVGLRKRTSIPGCGLAEYGASGKSHSQSDGSLARNEA